MTNPTTQERPHSSVTPNPPLSGLDDTVASRLRRAKVVLISGGNGRGRPWQTENFNLIRGAVASAVTRGSKSFTLDLKYRMGRYGTRRASARESARSDAVYAEVKSHPEFKSVRNELFRLLISRIEEANGATVYGLVTCRSGKHRSVAAVRNAAEGLVKNAAKEDVVQIDTAGLTKSEITHIAASLQ